MSVHFKGGGWFEKVLRFLNVLEPSPDMVLSKTKLAFWVALCLVVYAVGWLTNAMIVTDVIALFVTAAGLDGYRRHKQYSNGGDPYAEVPAPRAVDTVNERVQDEALDKL